jgi:uncharacterized protein (DUF342 family)
MRIEQISRLARIEAIYEASTAEEALFQGVGDLAVPREDLEVSQAGENRYRVKIVKRPGMFDLRFNPDGNSVVLEYLIPPVGEGKPVSVQEILERLRAGRAVHGIDRGAIETAVSEVHSGNRPATGILIARATPPVDGSDAEIVFTPETIAPFLNPSSPVRHLVRKGESFARKVPAVQPTPGVAVMGLEIPGKGGKDFTPSPGSNVELTAEGALKARIPGYLFIGKPSREAPQGIVDVEPAVQIASDGMSATLSLFPPALEERGIPSPQEILDLIRESGVTHGIRVKDLPKIHQYMANKKQPIKNVRIAEGRLPVKGADGRVDFSVPIRPQAGTIKEGSRIDFRERGFLRPVQAGSLLAEKIPPGAGQPGVTVTGKEIPSEPGKQAVLQAGNQVNVSADGREFRASTNGVILLNASEELSIVDLIEHRGDVDYSTGNLKMEGSLIIHGSVKPEFSVEAKGDVFIDGAIEAARVMAGGSVAVNRGIVGKEKGLVQAGVQISAPYAEGVTLISGGDIEILDTLLHSTVFCGKKISVLVRSGKIIGGLCLAGQLIQAREIGTPAGARTRLILGITRNQYLEMENLTGQIAAIQQEMNRPGTDDRIRTRYQGLIDEMAAKREALRASFPSEYPGIRVEIPGKVYPGAEISFGLHTAKITEVISNALFVFDSPSQSVLYKPLNLWGYPSPPFQTGSPFPNEIMLQSLWTISNRVPILRAANLS